MPPAHGDVGQCVSRHGFINSLGVAIGHPRSLPPKLVSIAVACAIWGLEWHHQQVLVLCDNIVVVQVIVAQLSRDRTLMHLLRCSHLFCAANDFKLRAEHIQGRHNVYSCHFDCPSVLCGPIFQQHVSQGWGDPLVSAFWLQLTLKGLKRAKPQAEDTQLPITPYILRRIKAALDQDPFKPHVVDGLLSGRFRFLMTGEMTSPAEGNFDPKWHVMPVDIAVDSIEHPSFIQVSLKRSKTDQARQGIKLCVGRTHNELCPVAVMPTYLAVRGFDHGPLFKTEQGLPLTRAKLVNLLKSALTTAGIDATRYSGHSFRIGAATTAAANGVSNATIQTLGQRASDAYWRYVCLPH